jgi:hypothetical protein
MIAPLVESEHNVPRIANKASFPNSQARKIQKHVDEKHELLAKTVWR